MLGLAGGWGRSVDGNGGKGQKRVAGSKIAGESLWGKAKNIVDKRMNE